MVSLSYNRQINCSSLSWCFYETLKSSFMVFFLNPAFFSICLRLFNLSSPFIPPPFGYSSWGRSFDWQLEEPDTQAQQWPALPRLRAPRLGNRGPAVPGPFHQDWAITATPHCSLHQIAGSAPGEEGVGRSPLWMSVTRERRRKKPMKTCWIEGKKKRGKMLNEAPDVVYGNNL